MAETKIQKSEHYDIVDRFLQLETYASIAKRYDVTRVRIRMIVANYVEPEKIKEVKETRSKNNKLKYQDGSYWKLRYKKLCKK